MSLVSRFAVRCIRFARGTPGFSRRRFPALHGDCWRCLDTEGNPFIADGHHSDGDFPRDVEGLIFIPIE